MTKIRFVPTRLVDNDSRMRNLAYILLSLNISYVYNIYTNTLSHKNLEHKYYKLYIIILSYSDFGFEGHH
jgi:hypothetical protein